MTLGKMGRKLLPGEPQNYIQKLENFESERENFNHYTRTRGSSQDFPGQTRTDSHRTIVVQEINNGDLNKSGEIGSHFSHWWLKAESQFLIGWLYLAFSSFFF